MKCLLLISFLFTVQHINPPILNEVNGTNSKGGITGVN